MLSIILIINFLIIDATNDSSLLGFSLNDKLLDYNYCNYATTCPSLLCNTLNNKTLSNMGLAFVAITPELGIYKKVSFISNATMIVFIINNQGSFITPISCTNVGDCFNNGSVLFNTNKNNSAIGFMGQCI